MHGESSTGEHSRRPDAGWLEALAPVDALLVHVGRTVRVLPALMPDNAAEERARLVASIARGDAAVPRWDPPRRRDEPALRRGIEAARGHVERALPGPIGDAYAARLEELALDLAILEALGDTRRVRALARRRWGTGAQPVSSAEGVAPLRVIAHAILRATPSAEEARTLEAVEVAARLREAVRAAGIPALDVRIDPRLVAGAATGERAIVLADRRFGAVEARRLVAHEVLGHAVAAANGAHARARLVATGTAGSFADQEGLALCLEEAAGALDAHRLRVLAARVVATDFVHAGVSFGDAAIELRRVHGFGVETAVGIAERAYRGGGVARDAGYLFGYLRVREALARGEATIDGLRRGRVGLDDLGWLALAEAEGLVPPPRHRPTLDAVVSP